MNPLLEQFLSETREFLQGIAEKLMALENAPNNSEVINELFRLVHTLKGNSGLFEFPEMTKVLHAGEDLLDAVRDGQVSFSRLLADRLLDAMDFVNLLTDEIETTGQISAHHSQDAVRLSELLRELILPVADFIPVPAISTEEIKDVTCSIEQIDSAWLITLPEDQRMLLYRETVEGNSLYLVEYFPEEQCFFKGEDPFYQVRQIPDMVWLSVQAREPWLPLTELDAYQCNLLFRVLTTAPEEQIQAFFRYTPEQIHLLPVSASQLILLQGEPNGGPVYEDFVLQALQLLSKDDTQSLIAITRSMLELSAPDLWIASALRWLLFVISIQPDNKTLQTQLIESLRTLTQPRWSAGTEITSEVVDQTKTEITSAQINKTSDEYGFSEFVYSEEDELAFQAIVNAQRQILKLPDQDDWLSGRLNAVAATLTACYQKHGLQYLLSSLPEALNSAIALNKSAPLLVWLDGSEAIENTQKIITSNETKPSASIVVEQQPIPDLSSKTDANNNDIKFGRRAEDSFIGPKTLKVEQEKIDRLMALIGEMVVAKNSLPYLAGRAETQFGVRELSREIKNQYAVINRIAEEMQDTIMQVRMMPVSFVFQRFPRLVRDTSRKLSKEVNLILEGENTEADKNIVEALSDPLIHIVRNSLDHGIETPDVRKAAGKPAAGKLLIRAKQTTDRVNIEISDDGKGINPELIKRKAYEKGIIDEITLERISDQDAINLVFAAGFSTAEAISDLSGRGVGMDVVRNAIEKINGTVYLESEVGKGTRIQLSLPLSMAVTNVMIVVFDKQIFGIPMDMVVETVRVPNKAIRNIKKHRTTVLRGRIVPLIGLNDLLAITAQPQINDDAEYATLVVRINDEQIGILVDDFRETVDIILKPMTGILGGLAGYAGSALLGDGSVLMVLNPKELL